MGVLQVAGEDRVGVQPSVQRVDGLWRKGGGRFRHGRREGPNLPSLILRLEKGDSRVVGRPEGLPNQTMHQIQRFAGVRIVENDGAVRSSFRIGARIEEFLAVMGQTQLETGVCHDFLYSVTTQ